MLLSDAKADNAARDAWLRTMRTEGPTACPVCLHTPQLRQHVFTATMALALIHLYHRGAPVAENTIPEVVTTGESLKKLALWGLVSEADGKIKLTEEGHEVAVKRARVAPICMSAHGVTLWLSGDPVWIDETLSQRFSYEDLMKAAV
jgi:hypothetical protein